MAKSLLILGAGGHGRFVREVAHSLTDASRATLYGKVDFLDDHADDAVGKIDDLGSFAGCYDDVFCGIGNNSVRETLQNRALALGFCVPTLIHPSSYVSPSATVGVGTVIAPKVIVNTNVAIGDGCILSVGSIVDHDAMIGDFCHVNTGAICMAGAHVKPGRKVGAGEVVSGFTER